MFVLLREDCKTRVFYKTDCTEHCKTHAFYKTDKHGSPSCLFCQWGELSNDQEDEIGMITLFA